MSTDEEGRDDERWSESMLEHGQQMVGSAAPLPQRPTSAPPTPPPSSGAPVCVNCGTSRPLIGQYEPPEVPAIADVRTQLADIAALFRTVADSDGEYAIAEVFEYLERTAAIVVDRPDLYAIIQRLHTWAKE